MATAARHGSVSAVAVSAGLGEGAAVSACDTSMVPGVVSVSAGSFFQGSVVMERGGTPAAVEDVGSVPLERKKETPSRLRVMRA